MKTLKFKTDLIPKILDGSKTMTWRLFDDKDITVGDNIVCINGDTGVEVSTIRVTAVQVKTLGEVTAADFAGHETYQNREEMLSTYKAYYGERVNWNSLLKMIDFQVIDESKVGL